MLVAKKIKHNFSQSSFKASVIVVFFAMSLIIVPTDSKPAHATTIQDLDNQIKAKKTQAQTLESEVANFDGQIQQLSGQIQTTQTDIDKTNAQIADTQSQIQAAEEKLKIQKETLNEYLRVIYEESNTSPLELIASSNSFSDFVDRSEYLQTMQLKIKETVEKIKSLKAELETKKRDLENKSSDLKTLKGNLDLQNKALNDQRAAKDNLLTQTNAQISDLAAKRANLVRIYNEMMSGGSSGYPYGNPPPENQICPNHCTPDPWGYYIGQCTSYAAWWRYAHGNPPPENTGAGNARDWIGNARSQGFSVDQSPKSGDIIVMPNVGGYGHVAIVEAVNGDGTIRISEYNWGMDSRYSVRNNVNPFNYGAYFIH